MSRELRQVRRYWPKARIQWINTTSTRFAVPGGRGVWITVHPDGATVTIDTMMSGRIRYSGRTIPEAMRAAGFFVRPQPRGRAPTRVLVDRQRPRKGARLGKRKREVSDEP